MTLKTAEAPVKCFVPSNEAMSSPPPPASSQSSDGDKRTKPKKPPAVTPRSFRRFFTPRSSRTSLGCSASRQALRDITSPALNRNEVAYTKGSESYVSFGDLLILNDEREDADNSSCAKRRKTSRRPSSGELPDPLERVHHALADEHGGVGSSDEKSRPLLVGSHEDMKLQQPEISSRPLPIRRSRVLDTSGHLLAQITGSGRNLPATNLDQTEGMSMQLRISYDSSLTCSGWRRQASTFYSRPEDLHACDSLPFCANSCNSKWQLVRRRFLGKYGH